MIRGKLTIHENYLSYTSTFNSKTLFGQSDIRIPKWNILQISVAKHLFSEKIVVETTHGNLEFTDFFSNPYALLVKTYETRKMGVSTFHKNTEGDT